MSQNSNKKLGYCAVLDAECFNVKDPNSSIDFPTVDNVKDWRNCLLCLLIECINELRVITGEVELIEEEENEHNSEES